MVSGILCIIASVISIPIFASYGDFYLMGLIGSVILMVGGLILIELHRGFKLLIENICKTEIIKTQKTPKEITINNDTDNTGKNITNKDLWEDKAKIIYNKLIQEHNFSIYNKDKETLHKKINDSVSIAFDLTYFFGFIMNYKSENIKTEKDKCLLVLSKYLENYFICNEIITDKIIGGYIKTDEINGIDIVFENFKNIEEEYKNTK